MSHFEQKVILKSSDLVFIKGSLDPYKVGFLKLLDV
jgi:hypothetical protein